MRNSPGIQRVNLAVLVLFLVAVYQFHADHQSFAAHVADRLPFASHPAQLVQKVRSHVQTVSLQAFVVDHLNRGKKKKTDNRGIVVVAA